MSNPGAPKAAFPQLGTEFVDAERHITLPWNQFLLMLWRLVGGATIPIANAVYFILNLPFDLQVWSVASGGVIGSLTFKDLPGAAAVPQAPAVSPFVFTAAVTGMFTAFACEVEFSRDAGVTYYPVTLTGGAVPMMKNDKVRLSWVGATAPTAVWFPSD